MAIYASIDIETTDDGDIVLDNVGDLKQATPQRTVAQSVNSLLLTNKGELLTDVGFGANIGNYIGERNSTDTRTLMERDIEFAIRQQGLVDPVDFEVDVTPIDVDKVAVLATVKGRYVNTNTSGNYNSFFLEPYNDITMAYIYPFDSGKLRALDS